jgi:hypothetical protein
MEKSGWLDRAIAPLHWLERARGWKRRGLLVLYVLIGLVGGVFGWRELSFWRLPDAPEPFDLARLGRVELADSANAMVAYRAIFARFGEVEHPNNVDRRAWDGSDWATADPLDRRWAEDHRAALAAWLPATDLRESLLVQPEALEMGTLLGPVQTLRSYARLALLEGSRLQEAGDLAGAWRLYRAALRASRHAGMHGGAVQRCIGIAVLRLARPRVESWALDPRVTPDLLRRAIADVEACAAMTSPASEMIRAEYFSARAALKLPELWVNLVDSGPYSRTDWTNHVTGVRWVRRFLRREPERTARVLRLIAAGYLAQSDRPPSLRPRLLFPEFMIYDHDPLTPAAVRSISPEDLNAWAKASVMGALGSFGNTVQALVDAEPGTFDRLRIRMAERAFEIERGRPARTYGDLLGPYLRALPPGFEPEDPASPGSG